MAAVLLLFTIAVLNLVIGLVTIAGSRPRGRFVFFALLELMLAWWCTTYAMELVLPAVPAKIVANNLKYTGISLTPLFWLFFVLRYTGAPAPRWLVGITLSVAAVGNLVVWTGFRYALFKTHFRAEPFGLFSTLQAQPGPAFHLLIVSVNLILLFGVVALLLYAIRIPAGQRSQPLLVMASTVVPWLASFVHLTGLRGAGGGALDWTPFAFAASALIIALAIVRYRLLNVVRVAYEVVFNSMQDPVVVLDERDRVVGLNQAAERTFGISYRQLERDPTYRDVARFTDLLTVLQVELEEDGEVAIGRGRKARSYDLQFSPVSVRAAAPAGSVLVLRDVTEKKKTADQLRALNRRMQLDLETAARMQESLLPTPPLVTGDVTVEWRFAACEELAGDTFNVFAFDDGQVGMFMADVTGHGVPASLLSVSLSRLLTPLPVRASLLLEAAPRGGSRPAAPATVAGLLNEMFWSETPAEQCFSFLYAVLDPDSLLLRYVSAGHPPLLHLPARAKGRFLRVPAFPIGFTREPDYREQELRLHRGDRLYLYSDGLVEGLSRQGEPFGYQRLLALLEENRALPPAAALEAASQSLHRWIRPARLEDDLSLVAVEIAPHHARS